MRTGTLEALGYLDNHKDIRFRDTSGLTTFPGHGFIAPDAIATPVTWKLPESDGIAGASLTTNGGGVLSWSVAPAPSIHKTKFDNSKLDNGVLTVEHGLPSPVQVQIWDNDNWTVIPDSIRMTDTEAGVIEVNLSSFLVAGILPGDPESWSVVVSG